MNQQIVIEYMIEMYQQLFADRYVAKLTNTVRIERLNIR